MLTQQYPAIDQSAPDSIGVPILCRESIAAPNVNDCVLLDSGVDINEGTTAMITSLPWTGGYVDSKQFSMLIEDDNAWRIVEFTVDGRSADLKNPILFTGSVSQMTVERLCGTGNGPLRVHIKHLTMTMTSSMDLTDDEIANWTTGRPSNPVTREGIRMALEIQRRRQASP
jgi:hypothetical protein